MEFNQNVMGVQGTNVYDLFSWAVDLPTGWTTKNGNQQSRKAPTTIPSVLAAFFCRRNLKSLVSGAFSAIDLAARRGCGWVSIGNGLLLSDTSMQAPVTTSSSSSSLFPFALTLQLMEGVFSSFRSSGGISSKCSFCEDPDTDPLRKVVISILEFVRLFLLEVARCSGKACGRGERGASLI